MATFGRETWAFLKFPATLCIIVPSSAHYRED